MTLEEAKAFLRIGHGEEDALLTGLLATAGAYCEAFTGRVLVEREVTERVARGPEWVRLQLNPVTAILRVGQLDPGAYALDIDAGGDGWVRAPGPAGESLEVRYRAGLAPEAAGVPPPLQHGIVRLAAHLFTHREAGAGAAPPAAVAALWRPWRRLPFAGEARRCSTR